MEKLVKHIASDVQKLAGSVQELTGDMKDLRGFVKEHLATKDELRDAKDELRTEMKGMEERLHTEIVGKHGNVENRLDLEADKRAQLDVRVEKLEKTR